MPQWALKFCKKPKPCYIMFYSLFLLLKISSILLCIFITSASSRPSLNFQSSNIKLMETDFLPHCTRNVIMEGNISDEQENISLENNTKKNNLINVTSTSQFYMSLKETTCIVLMV